MQDNTISVKEYFLETSFLELRCKQVVNVVDGKCLGHITDIVFDCKNGKVLGLIVPSAEKGFLNIFRPGKEIFIPFDNICKIGTDVILIEIFDGPPPPPPPQKKNKCQILPDATTCSSENVQTIPNKVLK